MIARRRLALAGSLACWLPAAALSQASTPATDSYIVPDAAPGRIPLAVNGRVAPLHVSAGDHPGVERAAHDLQTDIGKVTGTEPALVIDSVPTARHIVIVGTQGKRLVIAGSDRRGTIYGIYDVSGQIGVSPWYWWADVPVRTQALLYVLPGRYSLGEPAVKYRGIFINDEAPALSGWTRERFGGFNSTFYVTVFELIARRSTSSSGSWIPGSWCRSS